MIAYQAIDGVRRSRAEPGSTQRRWGWRIGVGHQPRSGALWCPRDRTVGVIGPQGSGKTPDPSGRRRSSTPPARRVKSPPTKPDDLLLSLPERSKGGRPCVVLDPFGLVPGLPELVWDPIAYCVDRMVSERRAKAFTAGTIHGTSHGSGTLRLASTPPKPQRY